MAFADTNPRKVLQGWGHSHVVLAAAADVGDLIGMDASNQWVLAQAAVTAVLARYVAGEDGEIGDTISVFRVAVLEAAYAAVAGEIGDVVYLSDTAGETGLVAGATTQVVGWVDSTNVILVNPRNPLALDASDIANDAIDSQHYAGGSIDLEHMSANSVDSPQYVDGSVDEEHLAVFAAAGGLNALRVATAEYNFADDGGLVSAIGLGVTIPDNAVIIGGGVDVITTCTSAGDLGTGALSVESANDIVNAVAIGTGTPWDLGGRDIIPDGTGTAQVKTTAAKEITFTIAVEAFTAGRFFVYLFYLVTA